MSKLTKNQKIAYAKVEANKAYKLSEAAALLKEITFTKFDASVDIDVRLGVDPRKANQMVRGVVTLPHGTGKQVRVLVLCTPEKEAEAQAAGADYVGLDEFVDKIKGGWTDVDVIICTPNVMGKVGAMRSGAQIISYELSVGMSIMTMVVLMGTMQFSEIVEGQDNGWFIFKGHIPAVIAFIIYLIAGNAECNRGPFDLPEAESELTAGYHTEYSGMGFGFFYLAEYLNLFIVASVAATIFLGGWMPLHIVGLDGFNAVMDYIPGFIWFFGKAFFVVFLLMWIKWTFPRLRIDQILNLEWKYLVPISMVNLLIMACCVAFGFHF